MFWKLTLAIALGFILGAVALGFLPLLWLGFGQAFHIDDYLPRVVVFTLKQAFLSTLLSVAIALPVALALARRQFFGREALLRIFSVPLALPAIVAILGIVGVYGNSGPFGGLFSIYGLKGILLAHVFFNMPLAVRLMLTRLESIPAENFRLAAQLNFSAGQVFRFIEWPQLASALMGIASLIFLLCTASFAVVLILGGGPQATTLEVAIYQSLRLDFDPARASILALAQLVTCGLLVLVAGQFAREIQVVPPTLARTRRWDGKSRFSKILDGLLIALGIVIVVPPILSVILSGIGSIRPDGSLFWASATSLLIGLASASLSIALGWVLAETAARQPRTFLKHMISHGLTLLVPIRGHGEGRGQAQPLGRFHSLHHRSVNRSSGWSQVADSSRHQDGLNAPIGTECLRELTKNQVGPSDNARCASGPRMGTRHAVGGPADAMPSRPSRFQNQFLLFLSAPFLQGLQIT